MKKTWFYLLLVIIPPLLASCKLWLTEASADLVRQQFSGKSYTGGNVMSNDDFGMNVGGYIALLGNQVFGNMNLRSSSNVYAAPEPGNFFTSERFALMPGLQLIRKGGKINDFGDTERVRLLYLEVPVYALYRHELPSKAVAFGGLGPYFGYGLSGKVKYTFNGQTTTFDAFDKSNGGFRRFDGGLAFTAGYQLPSSLQFRLAYELGLANIETGLDNRTKNRALSLSVGYSLNKLFAKKN